MNTHAETTFDNFVGQTNLRRRLKPFINEALETQAALPHILLTSQPGMGKTSLAQAIANRLGDELHVVDFSRMTPARMITFFRRFEGGIVLADEIHQLSRAQQDMLLTVMEEGKISTQAGGSIQVPWLTVIGATTDPQKLAPAFLSRFQLQFEYDEYTDEEMSQIVAGMCESMSVFISPENAERLAQGAAGNPRLARDLVKAYKAINHNGEPTIEEAFDICGVEYDGLKRVHVKYLKVLSNLGGQAGEKPISNFLDVSPGTLRSVEKLLLKRNMISMGTTAGRVLTAEGEARINGVKTLKPRRVVAP